VVQDRQPVAQGLGLVHVVGGEDHRAPFALDPPHHVPQAAPGLGVQPGGGLVQEHQLRIVHQGQGQGQPLLLAAGQGGVVGVGLVLELDQLQQLAGAAVPGVVAAVEGERLPGVILLNRLVLCSCTPIRSGSPGRAGASPAPAAGSRPHPAP